MSELNDNQKIVLEWLKNDFLSREDYNVLFDSIVTLSGFNGVPKKVERAYEVLDTAEDAQVLKAFAEWGLEHCQTTDTGE